MDDADSSDGYSQGELADFGNDVVGEKATPFGRNNACSKVVGEPPSFTANVTLYTLRPETN